VMYRLSVVPAPLAGMARATTPATAETVMMDANVRKRFSFMPLLLLKSLYWR
jgi:hypothetical protein